MIVRENNEGFQPDRNVVMGSGEFRPTEDVTISVRVITRRGSSKVARAALELARTRRKKLTFVHKDTVFKLGCGMFVEEVRKAAQDFPDVAVDDVIVDTFAMRLVRDPQTFDVVVTTTNMFGDILSDEAAGLVGGLGMAPGLCLGGGQIAMAQATHGSAPDIAGKGIANPYAMIESSRMLLEWLPLARDRCRRSRPPTTSARARPCALAPRKRATGDIRGTTGTRGMTDAILVHLARLKEIPMRKPVTRPDARRSDRDRRGDRRPCLAGEAPAAEADVILIGDRRQLAQGEADIGAKLDVRVVPTWPRLISPLPASRCSTSPTWTRPRSRAARSRRKRAGSRARRCSRRSGSGRRGNSTPSPSRRSTSRRCIPAAGAISTSTRCSPTSSATRAISPR